jgi:hypothetical protein
MRCGNCHGEWLIVFMISFLMDDPSAPSLAEALAGLLFHRSYTLTEQ